MRNEENAVSEYRAPEHAVPSSRLYRSVMVLAVLCLGLAGWHLAEWPQLVQPPPAPAGLLARASEGATAVAAPTEAPAAVASVSPEPTGTPVATEPAAVPEQRRYTVQPGDMLGAIAARFDSDVDAIVQANNLPSAATLAVGQELVIP